MIRLVALALVGAAACADTTCTLEIVSDRDPQLTFVSPGEQIAFRASITGRALSCGGLWLVNGVDGGSPLFGTIDSCGVYTAPAAFPDGLAELEIVADFPGTQNCIECCTSASMTFYPY